MSTKINVGIIGVGTVGAGGARALLEKSRLLEQRVGARVVLRRVCDRDFRRPRGVKLPARLRTRDPNAILHDPDIHIVVELIGGLEPARSIILEALRRGQHVVTVNKALLAHAGGELFAAAARAKRDPYFEASVGGGIPIIKALREGLVANDIDTILGIVNGTSNYILTRMKEKQVSFHEALLEAKQHGYAERNPSLDIEGHDASHKLAILTLLGFGVQVRLRDIHIEGISKISQADIQYADELGYCIKPLAIADVARTIASGSRPRIPLGGRRGRGALRLRRVGNVETRYYMRFLVTDKPGVLATIAGVLGRHHISIASVHQKERRAARVVPVVMMTHEAKESNVRRALQQIDRLGFVKQPTVTIRTEAPRSK